MSPSFRKEAFPPIALSRSAQFGLRCLKIFQPRLQKLPCTLLPVIAHLLPMVAVGLFSCPLPQIPCCQFQQLLTELLRTKKPPPPNERPTPASPRPPNKPLLPSWDASNPPAAPTPPNTPAVTAPQTPWAAIVAGGQF
jgi:hypothetical protein